jgi:hypothetical protein
MLYIKKYIKRVRGESVKEARAHTKVELHYLCSN